LNAGLTLGVESGQQDSALYLSTGDREMVINPTQTPAGNDQRWAPIATLDISPHLPQRDGYPFHRTPPQTGMPIEDTGERLASQNSGQKTYGGA